MIQITDKVFAIPMPDGAEGAHYDGANSIGFYLNGELRFVHFPSGSWRFLFTTKTATEEDARKVVPVIRNYHPETLLDQIFADVSVDTHLASMYSLLRSKGLDPDKNNYALIEKQSSVNQQKQKDANT